MKSDNAIILALIVCIIVVAGAFFFINGHGLSTQQEQIDNANSINTTNLTNTASGDGSY